MNIDDAVNTVTIQGQMLGRPSFSETETGQPLADFHVRHGSNTVWCVVVGNIAESLRRHKVFDAEVLATGRLDWLSGSPEQPHVLIQRLAFVDPGELAELRAARMSL